MFALERLTAPASSATDIGWAYASSPNDGYSGGTFNLHYFRSDYSNPDYDLGGTGYAMGFQLRTEAVPEPSSMVALLGFGILGGAVRMRRFKNLRKSN